MSEHFGRTVRRSHLIRTGTPESLGAVWSLVYFCTKSGHEYVQSTGRRQFRRPGRGGQNENTYFHWARQAQLSRWAFAEVSRSRSAVKLKRSQNTTSDGGPRHNWVARQTSFRNGDSVCYTETRRNQ